MAGPRVVSGARALLFERLINDDPQQPSEPRPFLLIDPRQLAQSIEREVSALFNTRAPLDADALESRQRGTLDYGIPDLSLFPPRDADAEARLARHLTSALAAFEPRLAAPKVTIRRIADPPGTLTAMIEGHLIIGEFREPVAFNVALRPHGG